MIRRNSDENDDDAIIPLEDDESASEKDDSDQEESAEVVIKRLKEELKRCRAEKQEYLDGWQRSRADYLNSKRRYESEKEGEADRFLQAYLIKLLPICDSFSEAEKSTEGWKHADETLRTGIGQIRAQFNALLEQYDVETIDTPGVDFDPHVHEAIASELVTEEQNNKVLKILQAGYKTKSLLIRPAKVAVGVTKAD